VEAYITAYKCLGLHNPYIGLHTVFEVRFESGKKIETSVKEDQFYREVSFFSVRVTRTQ
jgi:hypothetical protein